MGTKEKEREEEHDRHGREENGDEEEERRREPAAMCTKSGYNGVMSNERRRCSPAKKRARLHTQKVAVRACLLCTAGV